MTKITKNFMKTTGLDFSNQENKLGLSNSVEEPEP
jgi:hypothetical protein